MLNLHLAFTTRSITRKDSRACSITPSHARSMPQSTPLGFRCVSRGLRDAPWSSLRERPSASTPRHAISAANHQSHVGLAGQVGLFRGG
jgi:hypothetical protein